MQYDIIFVCIKYVFSVFLKLTIDNVENVDQATTINNTLSGILSFGVLVDKMAEAVSQVRKIWLIVAIIQFNIEHNPWCFEYILTEINDKIQYYKVRN